MTPRETPSTTSGSDPASRCRTWPPTAGGRSGSAPYAVRSASTSPAAAGRPSAPEPRSSPRRSRPRSATARAASGSARRGRASFAWSRRATPCAFVHEDGVPASLPGMDVREIIAGSVRSALARVLRRRPRPVRPAHGHDDSSLHGHAGERGRPVGQHGVRAVPREVGARPLDHDGERRISTTSIWHRARSRTTSPTPATSPGSTTTRRGRSTRTREASCGSRRSMGA